MEKPKDEREYIKWLSEQYKIDCSSKFERYYESVMNSVLRQFTAGVFWSNLIENWDTINQEYFSKTKFNLFAERLNSLFIKPYSSVLNKSYRKNIVLNNDWPNPPKTGWIYPNDPFEHLNDLLRTTIIVKYLDGAEFILNKLSEYARKNNYEFKCDYEAKDKGYYAIHAYIRPEFEIEKIDWDSRKIKMWIEIQITTQIQDTIKKLTHEYYEKRRSFIVDEKLAWQWNYKSDDFALNYMGHILHYLEGMIMEIREKKGEQDD